MNLEDETLLCAYLDDELDPAERLAVEWSVESSPALADQLRALAAARDLMAGLARPSIPVDLGPRVVARLAADRRRARLRALVRPGRVAVAVAGLSAMAASLLFALFLLHRAMQENPEAPVAVAVGPRVDPAPRVASPEPEPEPIPAPVPAPTAVVASSAEARERDDRLRVTRMLERPGVQLVLITTDVIDAAERIQGLIRDDPRKSSDFGRITIRAGIVVDPARPGSAEVFVVPVAEGGRRSFLDKLRGEFRDLRVAGDPGPELVTQLPEVGHVAVLQGAHASPLVEPPAELTPFIAKQGGEIPGDIFHRPRIFGPDDALGNPAAAGPRPAPPDLALADPPRAPRVSGPPLIGPPTSRPSPGEMVTLVVWVTRPPRR